MGQSDLAKPRILFVDDEPAILSGLKHLLYKARKKWDLVFAHGGAAALDESRAQPFDIVVSDMRMPGMDGATLLTEIRRTSPATMRVMLSGHADREAIVRALPSLHQLLAKPCTQDTLMRVLESGLGARMSPELRAVVGRLDTLPTPSEVYRELVRVLALPGSPLAEATALIETDPGLAAKVLQLVNSPYFGSGVRTCSIASAVGMLGTEGLRFIAETAPVFAEAVDRPEAIGAARRLQELSVRVAREVRARMPGPLAETAYAGALLRGVGNLVLYLHAPERYQREVLDRKDLAFRAREEAAFGIAHDELGAWLLRIWGLPDDIVDIVRYHHTVDQAPESARAACAMIDELHPA